MGTILIIKLKVITNFLSGFDAIRELFQINTLILHGPPKPFYEYIIHSSTFAIHRDLKPIAFQNICKVDAGKLTSLVTIKDLRLAIFLQRRQKRPDTKYSLPFDKKEFPSPFSEGQAIRQNIVQMLLQKKKEGRSILTGNEFHDRFFNGFNLLLDFEVARRLIYVKTRFSITHEDHCDFKDLPLIFSIKKILKSYGEMTLQKFNSLFLVKRSALTKVLISQNSSLFDQDTMKISPFVGEDRHRAIRSISSSKLSIKEDIAEAKLRKKLTYLHKSEETSEEGAELMKILTEKNIVSTVPENASSQDSAKDEIAPLDADESSNDL